MKNVTKQHQFVAFTNTVGENVIGYICHGTGNREALIALSEQKRRHITATCIGCGEAVHYDCWPLRLRTLFLPTVNFAEPQRRRRLLTLDGGWNGDTEYNPVTEMKQ